MSKRIDEIRADVKFCASGVYLGRLEGNIATLLEAYEVMRAALESVAGAKGGRGVAGVYGDLAVEALAEVDKIMEEQK